MQRAGLPLRFCGYKPVNFSSRQRHANDGSTAFTCIGLDFAIVEADCTVCDGQAYAETAGIGAARGVYAAKRVENRLELIRWYAGTAIKNRHNDVLAAVVLRGRQVNLNFSAALCVPNGVSDDVFNCAIEQVFVATDFAINVGLEYNRTLPLLCFELRVGNHAFNELI